MRFCFGFFKVSSALILDNCCELCCVGLEGKGEGKTMRLCLDILKISSSLILDNCCELCRVGLEGKGEGKTIRLCLDILKISSALILDNCCELCRVGLEGKGEGKTMPLCLDIFKISSAFILDNCCELGTTMSLRFELLKLSSALVLETCSTHYSVDVEGGKKEATSENRQISLIRVPRVGTKRKGQKGNNEAFGTAKRKEKDPTYKTPPCALYTRTRMRSWLPYVTEFLKSFWPAHSQPSRSYRKPQSGKPRADTRIKDWF